MVQVDPMKSQLKVHGSKHLKLTYDGLLSSFAFNFNLRHYLVVGVVEHQMRKVELKMRYFEAGAYTRPLFSST